MRRLVLLVCILGQLGVLGWIVYGREDLIRNGERIVVRTAPVDPRDPFRGDFVRLRYAFNGGDASEVVDSDDHRDIKKGQTIHAVLSTGPGDVHEFSHYSLAPPANGPFLTGTIQRLWRSGENRTGFQAEFNIEKLYVEQGRGIDIEKRRGARGELQTAMHVTLAINERGDTALVDYDWSPLAIGIEFRERDLPGQSAPGAQDGEPPPRRPVLREFNVLATVKNVSDDPLTLIDSPDQCHFMLLPRRQDVATDESRFSPLDPTCRNIDASASITLAPGEEHRISIDPDEPRWQMSQIDAAGTRRDGSLREIAPETMFRLVYTAPDPQSVPQNTPIWQGRILSQAFSFRGAID